MVMAHSLDRAEKRAARAAVIRTGQISVKTTLLLLRCRNVIEQSGGALRIVAEEMLIWGWAGTPEDRLFLDHREASELLAKARATENLSPQSRAAFLENELKLLDTLREEFDSVAEGQSRKLVEAHERFSAVMNQPRYQVVYPVLPMDILGIYILLPEAAS